VARWRQKCHKRAFGAGPKQQKCHNGASMPGLQRFLAHWSTMSDSTMSDVADFLDGVAVVGRSYTRA
jgi:hypothetical protein